MFLRHWWAQTGQPAGVAAIESSPECRHILMYTDIQKITKDQVFEWRKKFPKAVQVILGGGWPCVNHSVLNSQRKGAEAATSMLLQVREWLFEASDAVRLPPWKVVEFSENVVMDDQDFAAQVKKIGYTPYFLEAAQLGRCRRPRLYWIRGVDLIAGEDLKVRAKVSLQDHEYLAKEIKLDTERPPLEWYLAEGATLV